MSNNFCVACRNNIAELQPFWPGLKKCGSCGHIMADLDITSLEMKKIYDKNYFHGDEYCNYLSDRKVFERQFQSRLSYIEKFKPGGKLIEIGCAYGFFLAVAQRSYQVLGFDIAEEPTRYARDMLGLDARCEDFLDAKIEHLSVDVITMWDVIEHLPRPDLVVDKAAEVLKAGGFLFVTTGDIGSLIPRIRKERWRLIHPPTHIHYFNKSTITNMLEEAGLKIVNIRYVGSRRSIRQVAFSLFALGRDKPLSIYSIIVDSILGDFSFVLNTYDIMLVVAQKLK
jgi:2-polyprenyl-3-methyl-5-hydroxy-6-metoxy-1,4-benzoquinol methylase